MVIERQHPSWLVEHFTIKPHLDIQTDTVALRPREVLDERYFIARELREQGAGPLRRGHIHVVIAQEGPKQRNILGWRNPKIDGMLSVTARRDLLLHPINFLSGKDGKRHEIRINLGEMPSHAQDALRMGASESSLTRALNRDVNEQLYKGIFRLSASLRDRRARHILSFAGASAAFGISLNNALSSLDGNAITSVAVLLGKVLDKSFSLPLLERSLPWMVAGYAVGTAVFFLLYQKPKNARLHHKEEQYLSSHRNQPLLHLEYVG